MYFRDFFERQNRVYTLDLHVADKGYTYHDISNGSTSCIDHFSVYYSLCDSGMGVHRCKHALNPSKHLLVVEHRKDFLKYQKKPQKGWL